MTSHFLNIAGKRRLVINGDVAEVKQQILDAVRNAGGFIELPSVSGGTAVLITPGLPVFIETVTQQDGEEDLSAAGAASAQAVYRDVDDFDDWGI